MSRKIYNRLSFLTVSWLDESTLGTLRAYCRATHPPCYTLKPVAGGFLLRGRAFMDLGASSWLFRGKQVPNGLEGDLSLNATSGRVTARA